MAELTSDVVEQILLGLDVEDLLRCKSVCKSWQSLICSPRFVKAHLDRAYNNDRNNHQLGHRRIADFCLKTLDVDHCLYSNRLHIVGSCNGLVCLSPVDVEFELTNPSTREYKKLPTPPYQVHMHKITMIRSVVCWGFGYDSSADDYKVVAGFRKSYLKERTLFSVLTLKSNIWQVIGEAKYRCCPGIDGVLCGGALHWFMSAAKKKVIISLDLSTHEFKEMPLPTADEEYKWKGKHRLGVIEDCLCIYSYLSNSLCTKKWVMKNNKWQLYNDHCESKYDVAHHLTGVRSSHVVDSTSYVYSHDDGTRVPSNGDYIRSSIFVKSLVSPFPHANSNNEGQKRNAKGQELEVNKSVESSAKGNNKRKRKRKRSKTYCKHKRPLVWI